jgi:hypothetical protein
MYGPLASITPARLIASLLPKQTEKVSNPLEDLTDEELEQLDRLLATACQAEEPPQHWLPAGLAGPSAQGARLSAGRHRQDRAALTRVYVAERAEPYEGACAPWCSSHGVWE